ncbi:MAG: DUF2934 domain-containing protein [Acidobacteriota bacterium]
MSKQVSSESHGSIATEIPAADAMAATVGNQEEVCKLAHSYWQARGCPDGSPEVDWFRAERESNGLATASAA